VADLQQETRPPMSTDRERIRALEIQLSEIAADHRQDRIDLLAALTQVAVEVAHIRQQIGQHDCGESWPCRHIRRAKADLN
jgi:hypothetical protein